MHLVDLQFTPKDSLAVNIPFGIGALVATTDDVEFYYPFPFAPHGPAPVADGAFTFLNVPADLRGQASYIASGFACLLLDSIPLPCEDVIRLDTVGQTSADAISGTVVSLMMTSTY